MVGGAAATSGKAALNQIAARECGEVRDHHHDQNGCDQEEADRAALPGQQDHQQQRQHDRQHGVEPAREPVAADAVAGHQVTDRGRNDLDARHHRIERGGKSIAAARDGCADDDDLVAEGGRRHLAVQQRRRADGADRAVAAMEGQRQHVIDIGGNPSLASIRPSRWMAGSAPVASPATRNGNDSSTLSAVRNSIGKPRGVPEISVVRLTTPVAA